MLTTECNAEPYTHVFDGYLTWHWQYDGQVPAFPAVYGGALQMFGRAYRGGATKDLALRMKAGQQLVFGEQIGWLSPSVVDEAENFAFFRQVVRLRWQLKRYFYAGQMARPPKLVGEIPRVTADWQWSGHWPVTTDALLAGAWSLPAEKRLVLLFVNVGDQPLTVACNFDADTVRAVRRDAEPSRSSRPRGAARNGPFRGRSAATSRCRPAQREPGSCAASEPERCRNPGERWASAHRCIVSATLLSCPTFPPAACGTAARPLTISSARLNCPTFQALRRNVLHDFGMPRGGSR